MFYYSDFCLFFYFDGCNSLWRFLFVKLWSWLGMDYLLWVLFYACHEFMIHGLHDYGLLALLLAVD